MEDEINLLDYVRVIFKRWKIIAILFFIATVTAAILSFMMPKIYQAKASIYVISSGGLSSLMASFMPAGGAGLLGSVGGGGTADYLVTLLNSDTMKGKIANKLRLKENKFFIKPDTTDKIKITREKILKALTGITKVNVAKGGLITVSVETINPKLSADIANCYVDVLGKSMITSARNDRIFLGKQVDKTKNLLAVAEENLKNFQEGNKGIVLDKEAGELISSYISLKSERVANQIALSQANSLLQVSGSLEGVIKLKSEIVALQTKLQGLDGAISNLESQFSKFPEKSLAFARLLREVQLQGKLYETFVQQYELAKISEQKEDVKFQLIDKAYSPEKAIKPKKKQNVMIAGVLSVFMGIFLVFFLEYIENVKKLESKDINVNDR